MISMSQSEFPLLTRSYIEARHHQLNGGGKEWMPLRHRLTRVKNQGRLS
jgi:hypothetical protein